MDFVYHAICNNAAICLVYYKLRRYYKLRGGTARGHTKNKQHQNHRLRAASSKSIGVGG